MLAFFAGIIFYIRRLKKQYMLLHTGVNYGPAYDPKQYARLPEGTTLPPSPSIRHELSDDPRRSELRSLRLEDGDADDVGSGEGFVGIERGYVTEGGANEASSMQSVVRNFSRRFAMPGEAQSIGDGRRSA
jgi:hypothetical protein